MSVLFHLFPGRLAQIKLGPGGALGPGEVGPLADQPVHLSHMAPQHRQQHLSPGAVFPEITGMEDPFALRLHKEHIGVKGRVVYQKRGDPDIAHRHRCARLEGAGPFQSGTGPGAVGSRHPLQIAGQGQRHIPGGLPHPEGDRGQDPTDLAHVVPMIVGKKDAVTGLSRLGDAGQADLLLGERPGQRTAKVDQDAGGFRGQFGDAPADLVGPPIYRDGHWRSPAAGHPVSSRV